MLTYTCTHSTIRTNPVAQIPTETDGIGHLSTAGSYLLVNNLYCNFEVSLPTENRLRPAAVFKQTIFLDDPDAAAYDLDIHAIIYSQEWQRILTLNHDGRLLVFNMEGWDFNRVITEDATYRELNIETEFSWKGDIEFTLLIGRSIVSSSPIGHHSPDPAEPGLFISAPIHTKELARTREAVKLKYSVFLPELTRITAIAFEPTSNSLAFAASDKIYLARLNIDAVGGVTLGNLLWQREVDYQATYLEFTGRGIVVAGGHGLGLKEDPMDPTCLIGGGATTFNQDSGQIIYSRTFVEELSWGTSGQCLILSKDGQTLLGVDRYARLYSFALKSDRSEVLFEGERAASVKSYGIGHVAWLDNKLFCGFNRNGNQLHVFDFKGTSK